jgi:hypothetical protein
MPKKPKKPKQQDLLKPEPRVKTVKDISGVEFTILCARAADGEIHMERFGVGSSNSLWWVDYTENEIQA